MVFLALPGVILECRNHLQEQALSIAICGPKTKNKIKLEDFFFKFSQLVNVIYLAFDFRL